MAAVKRALKELRRIERAAERARVEAWETVFGAERRTAGPKCDRPCNGFEIAGGLCLCADRATAAVPGVVGAR